jgi:predicted  nucleic acid-binding Zn-ribbon protein
MESLKKDLMSARSKLSGVKKSFDDSSPSRSKDVSAAEPEQLGHDDEIADSDSDHSPQLEQELSARDAKIHNLETTVAALESEYKHNESRSSEVIIELRKRVAELELLLTKVTAERDELQSKFHAAESAIVDISNKYHACRAESELFKKKLRASQRTIEISKELEEDHIQKISDLQSQLAKSADALQSEQEQHAVTRNGLHEGAKAMVIAQNNAEKLRTQSNELTEEVKKVRKERDEIAESMEDLEHDYKVLETKYVTLGDDMASLRERGHDLLRERDDSWEQLQAALEKIGKPEKHLVSLASSIQVQTTGDATLEQPQEATKLAEPAVARMQSPADAHEQETQNCAPPKPPGSPPSAAIDATGKGSPAHFLNVQPNGGISTAVKTDTVPSPTVLTAGKGKPTNFDFKTMPIDALNPFSKLVGPGAVDAKDDGEASDEENRESTDKNNNNRDTTSQIVAAALGEQTLTEFGFKLKPIKLDQDSPKLASPIGTADVTQDHPAVRSEETAIGAAGDAVTSKEDEIYESSDSDSTVPGDVPSPIARARRSMPTSSSTTINSVAGSRELFIPGQEPVFTSGGPPIDEASTAADLPSEFAPVAEPPIVDEHADGLPSAVNSRSQDLPMITSNPPTASKAYRVSIPSEKTAEEEPPIGSQPESKATVTPKATPFSTPKPNPRTLNFKPSNLVPLVGLETSKESQTLWSNEVTNVSVPKGDGTEHADEGTSASKSSNAKAYVHKAAESAKPTDDSDTLQQQASPSTELSEHESPANEEEPEDEAVPDKGNFASFDALIADARAKRSQLGLSLKDEELDGEKFDETTSAESSLFGEWVEVASSCDETSQDGMSQDAITEDEPLQDGLSEAEHSHEELFGGEPSHNNPSKDDTLATEPPLTDPLAVDTPAGTATSSTVPVEEQQAQTSNPSPMQPAVPQQQRPWSDRMLSSRWAPSGANSLSDTRRQPRGNTQYSGNSHEDATGNGLGKHGGSRGSRGVGKGPRGNNHRRSK